MAGDGTGRALALAGEGFEDSIERLRELLRIPSVGTDPAYDPDTRRCAQWLADRLRELGFRARLVETGGQPCVLAHHDGPGHGPRLLYYGHYDVQPADPVELWESPPFEPVVVEGPRGPRVVARGAVDDKGQVMTFVEAFRAWKEATGSLPCPVTVVLEGEEESGSRHLEPFLEAHKGELAADVCVISDTGMLGVDRPAVTYMLRGLCYVELTLKGPSHDLHSGMYGGAVPNPIDALCRLLAGLHDAQGRVTVPGFYDDVAEVGTAELAAWEDIGFSEEDFLATAGLRTPAGELGRSVLERLWSRPTCDVNGIWGGYTGAGAKTVIPAKASAKLSFRLVPDQDPEKVLAGLRRYVEDRLPPDFAYELQEFGLSPAIRVPTDLPHLRAAERAAASVFGREPVLMGCGGSIPVVGSMKRLLGLDTLLIGFGLDDDRVHSPNEKFELVCYERGIRTHVALLGELAGA
jgi:acetylornithine deacetylase/succinyl-diaminopimelate desuccinylase-like protein